MNTFRGMYTSIMPCALVLSAGGMFGAYQAGVWKALSRSFHPDLIVGASVGALNSWAILAGAWFGPVQWPPKWNRGAVGKDTAMLAP